MMDLLRGLWNVSLELSLLAWQEGNRWTMQLVRVIILLTVVWPVTMVVAFYLLRSHLTPLDMAALALLPALVILLWIFCFMRSPLVWIALFAIPLARKAILILLTVLGVEAALGVCFALVPASFDPKATLTLLPLIGYAIACTVVLFLLWSLWKIPAIRKVIVFLIVVAAFIFICGGIKHFWDNVGNATAAAQQPKTVIVVQSTATVSAPKAETLLPPGGTASDGWAPKTPSPDDNDPNLPPKQATQQIAGKLITITITAARRLDDNHIELDGFVTSTSDQDIDFSLEENGIANLSGNTVEICREYTVFGNSWHAQVGRRAPQANFSIRLVDRSAAYAKIATVKFRTGVDGSVGLTEWFDPIRVQ